MRGPVIAAGLAMVAATAATAAAGPERCADQPRVHVAIGGDLGFAFSADPVGVALADYGYQVGHLMQGVMAAASVRPVWCLELGATARRWQTTEGTAPSGDRFVSRGDVIAASIGARPPVGDGVGAALAYEVGVMHTTQTLRGATVEGWVPTFAGRVEVALGRGPTQITIAFEASMYLADDWDTMAPSLGTVALQLGVLRGL